MGIYMFKKHLFPTCAKVQTDIYPEKLRRPPIESQSNIQKKLASFKMNVDKNWNLIFIF